MAEFASILDAAPTEVDRPKPLPSGSYVCVVKGLPRYDKSSKKQTEFAEFTLQPLSALNDVDPDELAQMGGLADKTIRHTFYLTENSIYRLDEFHTDLGIELEEGVSRRSRNEETPGKQCVVHIKHTASDDGKSVYANVASTAPVE